MKNFESVEPCVVCGKSGQGIVTYHHVYTRKAHPQHEHSLFNLLPLCRIHHNEAHNIGNQSLAKKYSRVANWLKDHGWEVQAGKLIHSGSL